MPHRSINSIQNKCEIAVRNQGKYTVVIALSGRKISLTLPAIPTNHSD